MAQLASIPQYNTRSMLPQYDLGLTTDKQVAKVFFSSVHPFIQPTDHWFWYIFLLFYSYIHWFFSFPWAFIQLFFQFIHSTSYSPIHPPIHSTFRCSILLPFNLEFIHSFIFIHFNFPFIHGQNVIPLYL